MTSAPFRIAGFILDGNNWSPVDPFTKKKVMQNFGDFCEVSM